MVVEEKTMTPSQSLHERPPRRGPASRRAPSKVVAEWVALLAASLVALARFLAAKDQAPETISAPREVDDAPFEGDDDG